MNSKNKKYTSSRKLFSMMQIGGAQKTMTIDGIKYQGAGILIINRHTNTRGITEDHVIYFRQNDNPLNLLDLPGGRCEDDHTSIEQTASVELYEESRKSISINSTILKSLPNVTVDGRSKGLDGKFRCYICRVQHISARIYDNNMNIFNHLVSINNPKFNHNTILQKSLIEKLKSYLETNKMCRIPVKNIEQLLGTTNNVCTDDEGNVVTLSRQSLRVYMEAKRTNKLPKCLPNGMMDTSILLIDLGKGSEIYNDSHLYLSPKGTLKGKTIKY